MRIRGFGPAVRLALATCLPLLQGCAVIRTVWTYSCDRVNDTADMLDLGITVTGRPCFSLYACGLGLATAGYGNVDGYFAGIGGSRIGIFRHYHFTLGLVLYSYEEFGWGSFDKKDPKTLSRRHVGVIGWMLPKPDSSGECVGGT